MKVTLDITTRRRADGETDTVSFRTDALFFPAHDGGRLVYRTPTEGMRDVVTTVTACGATVTLQNRGGVESRLVLEPGRTHRCRYAVSGGTLTLYVTAERVQNRLAEAELTLFAAYTLEMDGALSEHEITLTLAPVDAASL